MHVTFTRRMSKWGVASLALFVVERAMAEYELHLDSQSAPIPFRDWAAANQFCSVVQFVVDAIAAIRQEHPQARIIVLTTYEGDVLARRALKAGATGYILKDMIRTELLEAIRAVHRGRRYIPPKIAAEVAEHYAEDDLSEREIEVLREVARGTSNKIIAAHLSISEATVKAHIQKILVKLGASDRTHAVSIAMTRGFLM
jgi:DNA-binding NarL/FixJ family response regulator